MFIGSLVLFLSALFIGIFTSLPVINKMINTNFTVGEDPEFFYNRIQIFVAILLGMLTAVTQYLKYKNTDKKYLIKKIGIPTLLAIVISVCISYFGDVQYDTYGLGFLAAIHLAIFSGVYWALANASYILAGLKGKLSAAGASVAHVGFGLMLVGILISSSKKEVLSLNTTVALPFDPKSKENPLENQTLFKGMRTDMGKYWTTFVHSDSLSEDGKISYFNILFENKDGKEKFNLYPNLIKNSKGNEGFSNNPDAKHYWDRDIFSYISYARDIDKTEDTGTFRPYLVNINDTIRYSGGYMILDRVVRNPDNDRYDFTPSDTALMAELTVVSNDSMRYKARPVFYIRNDRVQLLPDTVLAQNLVVALNNIEIENNKLEISKLEIRVKESSNMIPFVALKVYQFPFIRLVWIGTMLMMVGFVMSIIRRIRLM